MWGWYSLCQAGRPRAVILHILTLWSPSSASTARTYQPTVQLHVDKSRAADLADLKVNPSVVKTLLLRVQLQRQHNSRESETSVITLNTFCNMNMLVPL